MQKPTMEWNTQKKIWQHLTDNHLFELWEPFLGTWQTSGWMQGGLVYELPMPERLTTDLESLSLPTQDGLLRTPVASEAEGGATSPAVSKAKGQTLRLSGQMIDMVAPDQLPSLPTPTVSDLYTANLSSTQQKEGSLHSVTLAQVFHREDLFPTPTTQDSSGKCRDHGGDLLHELTCGCPRSERREPDLMPTPTVFHTTMHDEDLDYFREREARSSTGQIGKSLGVALRMEMFPTPVASEGYKAPAQQDAETKGKTGQVWLSNEAKGLSNTGTGWGKFEPAIRRWEQVLGRPAPEPTKPDGKEGNHRLSSAFTEWMMGMPEGWITNAGISRNEELKAAGNGVVPQQAELALRILLQGVALD